MSVDERFNATFSSKDTTSLSVSFMEEITVKEIFHNMLGRLALATDLTSYVTRDIPIAVLTLIVDGRNNGEDDPSVSYIGFVNFKIYEKFSGN